MSLDAALLFRLGARCLRLPLGLRCLRAARGGTATSTGGLGSLGKGAADVTDLVKNDGCFRSLGVFEGFIGVLFGVIWWFCELLVIFELV